jgi:RND family efflux transporter MFP subunit
MPFGNAESSRERTKGLIDEPLSHPSRVGTRSNASHFLVPQGGVEDAVERVPTSLFFRIQRLIRSVSRLDLIILGMTILLAAFGSAAVQAAELPRVAMGVTEPLVDVLLSLPVPGIVTAIKFKEGDSVRKGDVILELDKRLEELEVQRRKLVVDTRKMDFDATVTLFEKTTGVSREELSKKEADYKVAMVEHQMAETELARRMIVAPNHGVITDLILDVGESMQAYQPVVRLVDPRRCVFECNLEAQAAAPLRLDQTVKLRLDTGAQPLSTTGRLMFLSPVADPASGLINVKIQFENPQGTIRPGLAGTMIFEE